MKKAGIVLLIISLVLALSFLQYWKENNYFSQDYFNFIKYLFIYDGLRILGAVLMVMMAPLYKKLDKRILIALAIISVVVLSGCFILNAHTFMFCRFAITPVSLVLGLSLMSLVTYNK